MNFKVSKNRTQVMGVLNVTPDSFYDGGRHDNSKSALDHALKMVGAGADVLDVGGESTRPGSESISLSEEISRVVPLIKKISHEVSKPNVSIDSYKTDVVEEALTAGASIVNDVYGLRSPGMIKLCSDHGVPVIIMHLQGNPKTMQENPTYTNVVSEIKDFFKQRLSAALDGGILAENIILDPGIGFGKTLEHNLEIIRNLGEFKELGHPILVGASRKSMIGTILDLHPSDRLEGSLAVAVSSVLNRASIIRTHDVLETVRAVRIADAICH